MFYAHAPQDDGLTFSVTGTGDGSVLTGTFIVTQFVPSEDGVGAAGMLSGTFTDAGGVAVTLVRNIVLPVTIGTTTCDILHLELGPASMDLLGVRIDLDGITLDITADSGAGSLGDLLCGVAAVLNSRESLAKLLNHIRERLW